MQSATNPSIAGTWPGLPGALKGAVIFTDSIPRFPGGSMIPNSGVLTWVNSSPGSGLGVFMSAATPYGTVPPAPCSAHEGTGLLRSLPVTPSNEATSPGSYKRPSSGFLLGDAEESGRDTMLCIQGNRLQAVKWRQWKAHLFQQDEFLSTWTPYSMPHLHNLEWDPREENEVDFPHGWVVQPMAAAAGAFLKSLAAEPPIKPGGPNPYTPPGPGDLRPQEHIQLGVITQFVTALVREHAEMPQPGHGIGHQSG